MRRGSLARVPMRGTVRPSTARLALALTLALWCTAAVLAASPADRRPSRPRRAGPPGDDLATADMMIGRALAQDWNFEQARLPPTRETVQLQERTEVIQGLSQLILEFIAFGKLWTMRLQANNALVSPDAVFETRTRKGILINQHSPPRPSCFYLGTVDIDENEYGHVSVTTCNNSTRALVITNANDYVLFPWSWKVPYHLRHRMRHPREARSSTSTNKYILEVANLTEYRAHMERSLNLSLRRRSRRQQGRAMPIKFPRFHPLKEPPGRVVYLELGLIMDKWYIADFKRNISLDQKDLIVHSAELINNAQLWYLHPTFGFQMWLLLKAVIFVHDDISVVDSQHTNTFIDSSCKWVKNTFPDQANWDAVLLLSSKDGIWNNRVGLSQRSGVCSPDGTGRCSGVSNLKFQMASLARLVAHELLHPLGVADDYEGSTSEHCFSGIMRQGVWQDHDWSVCSIQELERFLEISTSRCVHATSLQIPVTGLPLIPVNVAWRAKAEQSSTHGVASHRGRSSPGSREYLTWGAWKATDGGLSGPPRSLDFAIGEDFGSCTQTKEENEPWLTVELQQQYWNEPVLLLLLYNRDDCCNKRLRDFEVRIGFNENFTLNPLCLFYNGTVPGGRYGLAVIQCSAPLKGRYVSIQVKRPKAILTLCEVQVLQEIRLAPFDSSSLICVDHHPYCPYWSSTGECSHATYLKFMEANCSYSCGFCQRIDAPHWGPAAVHAPPQPRGRMTVQAQTQCRDKHEYCLHVAANGDCHSTFEMVQVCAQSCGFCDDDSGPESLPPKTLPYFIIGGPFDPITTTSSTSSVLGTSEQMKKTIPATDKVQLCSDSNDHCQIWKSRGYCILRTIQATCRLSCNTCVGSSVGSSTIALSLTPSVHPPVASTFSSINGSSTAAIVALTEDNRTTVLLQSANSSASSLASKGSTRISLLSSTTSAVMTKQTLGMSSVFTTMPTSTAPVPTRRPCIDMHRSCGAWAAAGHCSVADSVRRACPSSCSQCKPTKEELSATVPPPPTCRPDTYPSCPSWAKRGHCFQERVAEVCPTSCRRC